MTEQERERIAELEAENRRLKAQIKADAEQLHIDTEKWNKLDPGEAIVELLKITRNQEAKLGKIEAAWRWYCCGDVFSIPEKLYKITRLLDKLFLEKSKEEDDD